MDGLPQISDDMDDLPALSDLPDMGGGSGDGGIDGMEFPSTVSRMPTPMSRKAKAAVIVRILASENVKLSLAHFPEKTQVELARQMTDLRHIDRDTMVAVVEEFLQELEAIGVSFPGGLEGALNLLDGTISPDTAAKLRKQAGFSLTGDPWERIAEIDAERLLPILETESVEVCAVILSKLKVAKAAALLSMIPGDRARRVAYAISKTASVSPGVVQRIGISVAGQLDSQPPKAFSDAPTERVGAILNFSNASTRDGVLEGLDERDKEFAEEVRKNIFTFANIATRVDARDVSKITRAVEQEMLIKALAGAKGDAETSRDFILGNMSKRMADGLREEMDALGAIKDTEAEEAMTAVVGAIRELEAEGDLFLLTGGDE
ncbi:flagellar motor switch protein FliG [Celeribacter sp.]|uniref:flagellar motor switch protein FliG n=1 Tax=Celeribacter sp. TaxID=1890673 RepID=UPI003A8CE41E